MFQNKTSCDLPIAFAMESRKDDVMKASKSIFSKTTICRQQEIRMESI